MTGGCADPAPVPAAQRLRALLPPEAGVPLYGLALAAPGRSAGHGRGESGVPDGLEPALAGFAAAWRDPEPRAVATQFSKYWFRAAIPPALVCAAAGRAGPDMAPAGLRLETDAAGLPHLLAPDDPAIAAAPADGDAVLERLCAAHLDPAVAWLAARSGLAPRVFWSNAANVIAWYLDQLRTWPATGPGAAALAARWTDSARHPRFPGRNPLHMPRAHGSDASGGSGASPGAPRRRRICCARYLSADWELCETCPLSRASAARTAKR